MGVDPVNFESCLNQLAARGLLPEPCESAFVVGSFARGWENPGSDLDIYVVMPAPWQGPVTQQIAVTAHPGTVPATIEFVDHVRWEVKYWLDSQIAQVIARVSADRLERRDFSDPGLSLTELLLLGRLPHAIPLSGESWLRQQQERVRASAFRSVMINRALTMVDGCSEDAVGLMKAGDLESAVVSAKQAFTNAVEALLASYGEVEGTKWRARGFREADPKELSFDDYWEIETMTGYQPESQWRWVERVLQVCQRISTEIRL